MSDSNLVNEINKRRTFAIISHPPADQERHSLSPCDTFVSKKSYSVS